MGPEASACNWQGASAASGAKDEQAVRALAITLFTILLSQTSTCGATNACLWSSCSLYSLESVREAHKQHQPNNQNTTTGWSTKANAQIFMLLGKEQRRYTINSALLQYRFVKSTTIKEKKKKRQMWKMPHFGCKKDFVFPNSSSLRVFRHLLSPTELPGDSLYFPLFPFFPQRTKLMDWTELNHAQKTNQCSSGGPL